MKNFDELLGRDPNRGARWARPDAGRPGVDLLAHVAFDRVLAAGPLRQSLGRAILSRPATRAKQKPAQQTRLFRRHRCHLNDAVGAIALAIAAADAIVCNENL